MLFKATSNNTCNIKNVKHPYTKKLRVLGVNPPSGIDANKGIYNFSTKAMSDEEEKC